MKLSRIYASKLYLTSSRRKSIDAAINSADNVELVQQLSDYLDKDSKEKLAEAIEEEVQEEAAQAEEIDEENLDVDIDEEIGGDIPDDRNVFSPSYSGGGGAGPISDMGGGEEPDIFAEPEGDESSEGGESSDIPDEPVEEATAIYGEVTADTKIDDSINTVAEDIEIIKGTLNGREDTTGVIRAVITDNELWLYYKDEVNIGDIMVDVIEVLNGTAYTNLSFSRLARSNNAIVFDINAVAEPVKSIPEVEETKK